MAWSERAEEDTKRVGECELAERVGFEYKGGHPTYGWPWLSHQVKHTRNR
jgi:hypothetical protein